MNELTGQFASFGEYIVMYTNGIGMAALSRMEFDAHAVMTLTPIKGYKGALAYSQAVSAAKALAYASN